ncbi:Zinc finger CCCH domain-containing protein 16 [Raphanus sativus]|uniref:Zinc finger CCCH domain-containing protein 16 isoform X2 n=1 Tax=Raphanus sativus TaxID=3726 RepID=A0A6J0LSM8_RAPSA|nr:zinc finger CCCH domain-containing protein 16 isoform X2 [Raphanus sativus]KAJ4883829.1 Zinc finger CCCH domain-containing protein 16 [Raphanus sativus]
MRKELCRNFQQGSCRYGERCRYLHPQQTKPNNPFGFGTQSSRDQQQQNKSSSNPFGFGVQGASNSNRPNQSQPFQNTWQRNPSSGGGASSTQQSGKQTQQADHKCTDPAACKRFIQEDLKNERPMWKLTCYAHFKHLPCDISGDISYEELRAMAYEESKRGIPLQSIVERERNLQNAKVAEFENFLRSPYRGPVTANQTAPSIFPPASQVNSPPGFSAFNQQPAFPNTNAGGGVSSSGPPNPFGRFNQQPNAFSLNTPQPAPSGPSGFQTQPSSFGPGPVTPSGFQTQPSAAFKPSPFGPGPVAPSGFQTQPSAMFKPASFGLGPVAPSGFQSQPASFGPGPGLAAPAQNSNIFPSVTPTPAFNSNQNNQTAFNFNSPVVDTTNTPSGTELQAGGAPVDTSIWLKEKWNPGEIPEQAPPDAFVHR